MTSDTPTIQFVRKRDQVSTKKQRLIQVIRDPERKPLPKIIYELIALSIVKKSFPPNFYMSRYLFKKSRTNIYDFYPYSYFGKLNRFFNDDEARPVLENKLFSHLFYTPLDVAMPRLLAFNHNETFIAGNESFRILNHEKFRQFLGNIFSMIPDNDAIFIKKTWGSYGGDSIFKIDRRQLNGSNGLDALYNKIAGSDFIFQERLRQHPDLNCLNSSCVNTIRIDTFIDRNRNVEPISAYLRVGLEGAAVDNISAGGMSVAIDIETGRLARQGYMESSKNWTVLVEEHPDTRKRFDETVIPYFDEVKKLVCRMAMMVPELRLIGWDIAIGEKGPVLIEGNSFYDMTGGDLTYGGYRKNPVFQKIVSEFNEGRK